MPQVTTSSFNLGYPPFANWINNFDDNHASRPVSPRPRPGKMKTVFLLELTAGDVQSIDVVLQNTIKYFWNTYPQEFTKCPIVDTKGTIETNLSLLTTYYNAGFRRFVGFTNSNILTGVLEWFNMHPEAIGCTIFGVSTELSIPKNVYRFLPNNSYRLTTITDQITVARRVYYIYQDGLLVSEDILNLLNDLSLDDLRTYPATSSNLTESDLETFLSGSNSNDIIITLLSTLRNEYINLYSGALTFLGQQYDVAANQLPIIPAGIASDKLSNTYNAVTFKGVNTSILWRNGYNALGQSNYNATALNVLNFLNDYANNDLIDNINSHYGSLQFDPVTKDSLYPSILLQTFISGVFEDTYLYVEDPYLGTYTATLTGVSQTPSEIIPISANVPFSGKAIALLELSNVAYVYDQIIRDSIYYCWYKDSSLPKFPIIDTQAVTDITPLLDQYYAEGYRVFLGMSTPIVLQNSKNWFASHPDTIGISQIGAGAIDNVPSNVFRIQVSDSSIIGMFATTVLTPAAPYGIYYVYTESSITAQSIKALLQYLYGAQVYTQAINDTTYPLDYTTLNPFFTGIQANSVVVTFLTSNQSYADVFNDPLMNSVPAKQYLTNISTVPIITNMNAQNALDMKLFDLTETFPNTSNLWNEVRLYLTNKYGVDTTSFETINSLKMVQYILAGKDTKLLGSHSGVLQFNPAAPPSNPPPAPPRLLTYPSALLTQYQKTQNAFVNYSITFVDPYLGNFTASFV